MQRIASHRTADRRHSTASQNTAAPHEAPQHTALQGACPWSHLIAHGRARTQICLPSSSRTMSQAEPAEAMGLDQADRAYVQACACPRTQMPACMNAYDRICDSSHLHEHVCTVSKTFDARELCIDTASTAWQYAWSVHSYVRQPVRGHVLRHVDANVHLCMDMCIDFCIDVCIDMTIDKYAFLHTDMCMMPAQKS